MAQSVGKVYGTALFELCCEEGCLEKVFEELCAVKELLWDSGDDVVGELLKALESPVISGEDKTGLIKTVLGGRVSDLTLDFLCLVAEKGRVRFLPDMVGELRGMYNEKMGILEVTAVTAEPLGAELGEKLTAKLAAKTGKTVRLTTEVDKTIIGGIILRYEGREIDSSVRAKLDKLRAQIDGVIA